MPKQKAKQNECEEVVTWRAMFPNKGVDAKAVRDAFERIRARNNGVLTKELVVEAAKSAKSPLHKFFDWDDAEASHKWRVSQAGQLIAAIRVEHKKMPGVPVQEYNIVQKSHPRWKGDSRYKTIDEIMSNQDEKNELLYRAIQELHAFRKKFGVLSELANLIAVVDDTITELGEAMGDTP